MYSHINLELNWNSHTVQGDCLSIPRYVELNSEKLRKKYLAFIHDLGQFSIEGRRVADYFKLNHDFSLWWMTLLAEKSVYKSPFIQDCLKMFALEDILRAEKPNKIIIHGVDSGEAKEAILHLCSVVNIEVVFILQMDKSKEKKLNFKNIYHSLPHLMQGVLLLARNVMKFSSLKKSLTPKWSSGSQSLFIFSYFIHLDKESCLKGKFYSRQWEILPKLLHDLGYKINWIHHFLFSNEVPTVTTGVDYVRRFNSEPDKLDVHQFLGSYLSYSIIIKTIFEWARLVSVSIRLSRQVDRAFSPKFSSISLWPLLKNDWYASTQGKVGMQNILWVHLMDKALDDLPKQELGLYLYEGQGWERAFIYMWRKHNHGRLIAVAHSTVRFWDLRYFNDLRTIVNEEVLSMPQPNRIAVNGPVAWNAFRNASFPVELLEKVEALRYLNLSSAINRKGGSIEYPLRLLVLGDIMRNTTTEMINLLSSELIKESVKKFEITVKAHPGNQIIKEDFPDLQFEIVYDPLHEILHKFDLVYGASSSSANLDAYLSGLPVIVHFIDGDLVVSPLSGLKNVSFVCNSEEIRKALDKKYSRKNIQQDDIFWLDNNLPKWRNLIANSL